jgi:hypothetical protein
VRATCGQKQEAAATTALAFSLHVDATMTCYILRLSPEVLEVICGYLKDVPGGHNILVRLLCTSKAWKVCSQRFLNSHHDVVGLTRLFRPGIGIDTHTKRLSELVYLRYRAFRTPRSDLLRQSRSAWHCSFS